MQTTALAAKLENRPYGENIMLRKSEMGNLPEGTRPTIWGDSEGAIAQYRGPGGLHLLEFEDTYMVHVDRADPELDPLGHIIHDSPETGLALIAGGFTALYVGKHWYELRKDDSDWAKLEAVIIGVLAGLIIGGCAYYIGKYMRKG